MKALIAFFAQNRVASNLLMLFIFAAGFLSIAAIPKEYLPPRVDSVVRVDISYPGASPREIEQALCLPVEEAVRDVEGIAHINTTASEGLCRVGLSLEDGFDPNVFREQIAARIESIAVFPKDAEKAQVRTYKRAYDPLATVCVHGNVDALALARHAKRIRDALARLPEVREVQLSGVQPYEVSVEIPARHLSRYGLALSEVADALRQQVLDLPAGSLRTPEGSLLLQARALTDKPQALAALAVRQDKQGGVLRLGDIATIKAQPAFSEATLRCDGEPSILVQIQPKRQLLATLQAVETEVERQRATLPESITLGLYTLGNGYQELLDIFLGNALGGLGFDVLILALFLRGRVAFWANMGIAVSFLGALWGMTVLGLSLNERSLIAFILVLGLVVDDAVIIGENVLSQQAKGFPGVAGAVKGAQGVAKPVILMLVCAALGFAPSLFLPGLEGEEIADGTRVILLALLFSFVDSFLILPVHLAHSPKWTYVPGRLSSGLERAQTRAEQLLAWLIAVVYRPVLALALKQRYLTLTAALGLLLVVGAAVYSQRVTVQWRPTMRDYYLQVFLAFPEAAPLADKQAIMSRLEHSALRLRQELGLPLDGKSLALWTESDTGWGALAMNTTDPKWDQMTWEFVRRLRLAIQPLPAGFSLLVCADYETDACFADRSPLEVQVSAPDMETLRAGASALKAQLARYAGVTDIRDSYRSGKPELGLRLKPPAEGLGLSLENLAQQVRASFHGVEIRHFLAGPEEVKLVLRSPSEERGSLPQLRALPVRLPDGSSVPFAQVADAEFHPGVGMITRTDRQRIQTIGARIDRSQGDPERIYAQLEREVFPALERQYPGLSFHPGQENQVIQKTLSALERHTVLAWLAIYALIAVLFRSYSLPLTVMAVMPFGFIGAVLGHVLLGKAMTLNSFIGIIAVAGVVLNDSLILVDTVKRRSAAGLPLHQAVILAGEARFRSIFVTALSTFFGLLPLMAETSIQATLMIPMAVSIAFGVPFAAGISLLLVPVCCLIQEDLRNLFAGKGKNARAGLNQKHDAPELNNPNSP